MGFDCINPDHCLLFYFVSTWLANIQLLSLKSNLENVI